MLIKNKKKISFPTLLDILYINSFIALHQNKVFLNGYVITAYYRLSLPIITYRRLSSLITD